MGFFGWLKAGQRWHLLELARELQHGETLDARIAAADALGAERSFAGVDVIGVLAAAGLEAIAAWEAAKTTAAAAQNVEPGEVDLAPHADPSRLTAAAARALKHLESHRDAAVRQRAQHALEDVQRAVGSNPLVQQVGFTRAMYFDTGKCMVCLHHLGFVRKLPGGVVDGDSLIHALTDAAYQCQACGASICRNCAGHRRCLKCGGSAFDLHPRLRG